PGNNQATDVNGGTAQADLAITKVGAPAPYVPGSTLSYTIVVSNNGPSAVTNARVQDALPAPLAGFSWSCAATPPSACGTTSATGDIDALVSLPSGGSATFTVSGTVPSSLTGSLVNTAT